MTLSIPNPSLLKPNPKPYRFTFPLQRRFLSGDNGFPCVQRVFLSSDRRFSSGVVRVRAKPKELVLGNPSVTVEKGKYSYDVETLINKLSSLPPRGSIARCLDMFKNKLSLNDFALVFKEFAQRGDWQRSLRLFKYMQRQIWCKPNEQIYTIMISLLGRENLLDKSAEVFDEMPSQGVPRSVFSYTALINAYGRHEEGLGWEGLLGLFAEMRHEGIQPDIVTYNTLLSACGSRGLGDEAEMVFRTMNDGGVLPDITTYSYLVETFGKLGKLEKVSELLREMELGGNLPDITSYNVLLDAHAKMGSIKESMEVFRQMQAAGCLANATTYSILLNLYGSNGRYDEVRELFLEMKASNTEPNAATYNILIQVFGEGGYFKEVVTLFHDMVEENVEPNMETYEGLIFACGKGGLHEDVKKILLYMNERGIVPSSKAYTGAIEAYGLAALYEEALVAFNTMNEVESKPTVETYNSLLHAFARGIHSMLSLKQFRQGGQFEEAIKTFVGMEKVRCDPDERTLEAVLSVYCFAGLVDESKEQFQEIKASGILPSVMSYCMLLAVYAKSNRWGNAYELLEEMYTNRVSNIHQVTGQMIKGEFDDESNWQMVEYVLDKLNSEGYGLGMRFYNALLEALWWLGQRERAARVLNEATKRGLFPELFRNNKLVWSVDVHRMWEGGAYTAISVWLNKMHEMFINGEDLPQLATVVVVRGRMEINSTTQDLPIARAAYTFLQDNVSSLFNFAGWNKGRIICQRSQLKRILSGTESSSDGSKRDNIIILSNSPFSPPGTRKSTMEAKNGKFDNANSETKTSTRTELMTSTV
ncbi:Pentatricopeptide repeat-containing protein [Melia azedarach]|uniref:Pentatricopeptide repeat-containing protein n=1 Tax=Melia azedarach TaxID=155640 RepID=A0ACC1XMU2_MELAZ|nr:Pentatricopeptide repeat-containing protein [Melia azedarach]